jgi:histone H3/H4
MPRQKLLVPQAPLIRIFRSVEDIRVSKKAAESLALFLYGQAKVVAKKSGEIAKHRNSRTVNGGDVRLAI